MNDYKYVIYARKSSESEDRQVLSIEAQLSELQELAKRLGLSVVDVLTESMTAKQPGRPVFNKLLERIVSGEIQGILCWKLDRLARNPVDGGNISWALQQGRIKEIQTHSQRYLPTDNVLMMQVEFGMANQFIIDLSSNTKRGLKQKAEKGYPSGQAKIGYLNDKTEDHGNRFWVVDPLRFELVRLIFLKFLKGSYSVADVYRYAVDELLLTTVQRKRIGGKLVTRSYVYEMLRDPIYAGFFYYNGHKYQLNSSLQRVITEDQYWRVQELLGRSGIPREKGAIKEGVYNHLMVCGHCTGVVTHDKKHQVICSNCKHKFACKSKVACPNCGIVIDDMVKPRRVEYDYYRCFKRKDRTCPGKSILEKDIREQIITFCEQNLRTSPALSEWLRENIEQVVSGELKEKMIQKESVEKEKLAIRHEEIELLRMRSKKQINDEELEMLKIDLEDRKNKLNKIDINKIEDNIEHLNNIVTLAEMSTEIMTNGKPDEKREFLSQICSNLELNGKKVTITMLPEIKVLVEGLRSIKEKIPLFEPSKIVDTSTRNLVFTQAIPSLLPG